MGYNTFPCNPYPISSEELNKGNNDELNTRVAALEEDVSTLEGDVSDLNSNKASKVDIATEFSDLTNYNAGDLVYYEGALYEFQVDHTAGAWETSEVIQKDLSDIVTTLKSGLTNLNTYIYGPENKSNLDFNTLTEKYSCRIGNLATCTNIPNSASTGVSGVLVIEPHGSTIIQKFYGNLGESHRLSFDTGTTWENWV